MINLGYNMSTIALTFATMMGAFGGFPAPPKIFVKLTSYQIVQWFLLFVLLFQGGAGGDVVLAAIFTGITFLVYKFLRYFEKNDDELVII